MEIFLKKKFLEFKTNLVEQPHFYTAFLNCNENWLLNHEILVPKQQAIGTCIEGIKGTVSLGNKVILK